MPAATLPLFQAILLVGYVHLAGSIRRYYGAAEGGARHHRVQGKAIAAKESSP